MSFIYTRADHLASQNTGFEPQRMHNWSVIFQLPEAVVGGGASALETIQLSLVSGFLPTTDNEVVQLQYGNEQVFIAGRARVDEGRIVCRDFIDMPTAEILMRWRRTVYNPATGGINLARNYKTQASIVLEGPHVDDLTSPAAQGDTNELEPIAPNYNVDTTYARIWKLQGCWPVSVNPAAQGLSMETGATVLMDLTLRYDKAIPSFAYGARLA